MADEFKFEGFQSPNYTQIPDEVFDVLLPRLSGAQVKCLLYVLRRTFGFKKSHDNISLSQVVNGIKTRDGKILDGGAGVAKGTASQALNDLVELGVLIKRRNSSKEKGDLATTYAPNIVGIPVRNPGAPVSGNKTPPTTDSGDVPVSENKTRGGTETEHRGVLKSDTQETALQKTESTGTGRQKSQETKPDALRTSWNRATDPPNRDRSHTTTPPTVRWSVLKSKYGLDDRQCGTVERLVELQSAVLGNVGENHSLYVQRASEATRDGNYGKLEGLLRNAEEDYRRKPPRTNRSREFHGRWKNHLADEAQQTADPAELAKLTARLGANKSWPRDKPKTRDDSLDPQEQQRRRYLEDLMNRGYRVPQSIAGASLPEIAAWADKQPSLLSGR